MSKKITRIGAIILLALLTTFINLPLNTHEQWFSFDSKQYEKQRTQDLNYKQRFQKFLYDSRIHLGLDLQGGTQLDFNIDLRKVAEKDKEQIIEGVKEVINKRINNLGVTEPNIYLSQIADEQHIIVELAGIKDIEEAKKTVGKTIQLEFKEERTTPESPEKVNIIKNQALQGLEKVNSEKITFEQLGEEENKAFPNYVEFQQDFFSGFADEITKEEVKKYAFEVGVGELFPELVEIKDSDNELKIVGGGTSVKNNTGFALYKVVERKDEKRQITHPKQATVRHILVSYKGAQSAGESVTRTEEEAKKRAEEALQKIKAGEKLESLTTEYSDDASNKDTGGLLEQPVKANEATYVQEFKDAALKLTKDARLSEIVKSPFGFHIIEALEVKDESKEEKTEPKVKLSRIMYSTLPDPWQETGLTGEHFVHADVAFGQLLEPYVQIQFNDEGAKLFEQITERNVDKPVAIFVGGELISSPRVNEKISGGKAQITGRFKVDDAKNLARDLNTGAIPAPITLNGQYNIGASLGQDALDKSLKAGLIGILLVMLFLIMYYRLPGLLANLALIIYAGILMFLIKISLPYGIALLVSIILFVILVTKILKSSESSWEKLISFILASAILFFLTFLLTNSLVLTLAGVAGIILSIGMAVDANILIFERIKEELSDNKRSLASAIEIGFDRAWSSIRDSNFSSLITCAILFYFGTSIIRGFAFNLAIGILVSIFTAITVTKTFLKTFTGTKVEQHLSLFGARENRKKLNLVIIPRAKVWFLFSGTLFLVSIVSFITFGFKAGIDFTGGTLMEVEFEKTVEADEIRKSLKQVEEQINKTSSVSSESKTETVPEQTITLNAKEKTTEVGPVTTNEVSQEKVELANANMVTSGEKSYIIRSKHIDNETHDLIVKQFETSFGKINEKRFTTIGPTVGKTLAKRAFIALGVAMLMIVLYIAFAFRHVPRYANAWRFGICAVIALIHDVTLTLGLFSILGKVLGIEIDSLFITALLTVIGFSVHDTIVVFDRIRENLKLQQRGDSFEKVANDSVNQTMARSINTSMTALFTLLSLFFLGSESIKYFTLALIFGITVGTYSSIFIASPLLVVWRKWTEKG